ncbi:MAG: ATP-binding protein [Actinomycetota bacterium]
MMVHEVRKTVTVVFCDVSGSTSMGEQLDPETLRRVMTRYFEEMRSILEKHGGTVEKFIGDAVMAVFGVPSVHEDDALRAVRAAAEMREALRGLNEELERDHGVSIASRIGVNTGEVVAGAGDAPGGTTLITGDAVNVAARLEEAAAAGQILIGDATYVLVRDAVTVDSVEPLAVKGKAEPIVAYDLRGVAPGAAGVARHLDAPLVGRKVELVALDDALDRAVLDRAPVLATVIGTPGVGKSRLVDEFARLHADNATVVHGRCLSYGDGITYWPVVEILTTVAGVRETDTSDEVRSKIARLLEDSLDAPIVVERLAEFLGLAGASAAPEETHWAVRRLFEALAASRPLVSVFEDIHWAEPALRDLIEHVAAWSSGSPIILLCTARPDLLEDRADWGTVTRRAVSLELAPLSEDESDQLTANLIGSSTLPAEAKEIVEAAEGNPLFLEQLVGMLMDEGHLRRAGDAWVAADDLSSLSVPPTITGILDARIERIAPSERDVLERGSVEGRVFHWSSVTALSDGVPPAQVGHDLLSLVRRGLIDPVPAQFGGGEAFSFRHALVREAAYGRLSKARRSDLHERHARWVERAAGDRVAEFEDVLAYHLEQAAGLRAELGPADDALRALAAEAARRLASAGRRASARGDLRAAVSLLERAITLLPPDDPTRADLLVRFGEAVAGAGDSSRAARTFEEARALAVRLGDDRIEMHARLQGATFRISFDPEGATDELDRLVREAIPILEGLDDDEGLAIAWTAAGHVALIHGDGEGMFTSFERAAEHAERAADPIGTSEALSWLISATVLGRIGPERAIETIHGIIARKSRDRKLEAIAAIHEAMALAMLGRSDDGRRLYLRGYAILEDLGMTLWAGGTRYAAGYIEMLAGDLTAAEREFRLGIEALRSVGDLGFLSSQAAELGQVLYEQGRLEEAEEMAGFAQRSGASEDISTQVPWRGVRAKLLARRGEFEPAIALVEEAVAMMEGSDFVENRAEALSDLAEVLQLSGRADEAVAPLREALGEVERKGVLPLVERIRSRLAAIEADTDFTLS